MILTRARQGMIIFVPRGAAVDPTRPPAYYDQTYEFLRNCGLQDLGQAAQAHIPDLRCVVPAALARR